MTKLPKVRSGSIATNKGCPRHVCFALDSDRIADIGSFVPTTEVPDTTFRRRQKQRKLFPR